MDEREQIEALLRVVDARLDDVIAPVRKAAKLAVERAKNRDGVIPGYRLPYLQNLVANLLADVFGDSPAAQFDAEGRPLTPYARIVGESIREATQLAVDPYLDQIERYTAEATNVRAALLRGRPAGEPQRLVEPARTWVDPNGYALSHRLWQNGEEVRSSIDALLEFHIGQGTSATQLGRELEQFLTLGGREQKTRTPYGNKGLYAPRRLARTETARAYGNATREVARINPFVNAVGWRLSAIHPEEDNCSTHAASDSHKLGRGNYPPNRVPRFPDHPNCRCYLVQIPVENPQLVAEQLGKWARGQSIAELDDRDAPSLDAGSLVRHLTGIARPDD